MSDDLQTRRDDVVIWTLGEHQTGEMMSEGKDQGAYGVALQLGSMQAFCWTDIEIEPSFHIGLVSSSRLFERRNQKIPFRSHPTLSQGYIGGIPSCSFSAELTLGATILGLLKAQTLMSC